MKRRNVIKGLALLPVVGNVLSSEGAELAIGQAGETETTLNSFWQRLIFTDLWVLSPLSIVVVLIP